MRWDDAVLDVYRDYARLRLIITFLTEGGELDQMILPDRENPHAFLWPPAWWQE